MNKNLKKFLLIITTIIVVYALRNIVLVALQKDSPTIENQKVVKEEDVGLHTIDYARVDERYSIVGNKKEIIIKDKGEKPRTIQKINLENTDFEDSGRGYPEFYSVDLNFDGQLDLQVLMFKTVHAEIFDFWIYSTTTKKFELAKDIGHVAYPIFYPEEKKITSFINRGCAGECYEIKTYGLVEGELKLIFTAKN